MFKDVTIYKTYSYFKDEKIKVQRIGKIKLIC